MSQYGYGPPVAVPQQSRRGRLAPVIAVGVVVAVLASALNAVFSFGMMFATDSCGTGSSSFGAAACNTSAWIVLVALPWAGLLVGIVTAVVVSTVVRRRGRSAWLGLAAGIGLYAITFLISSGVVFA